jgi:hypothetical protein
MMKMSLLAILACLLCPALLPGFELGIPVEVDTSASFPTTKPSREAREEVMMLARGKAILAGLPANTTLDDIIDAIFVQRGKGFDRDEALKAFMASEAAGFIQTEEVVDENAIYPKKSQVYKYKLEYKARVMPFAKLFKPVLDFTLKAPKTELKAGEETELSLTPAQDGWLYVFDLTPGGNVILLYPAAGGNEVKLKKNLPWTLKLAAELPPGADKGFRTIYAVFYKDAKPGWRKFLPTPDEPEDFITIGKVSYNMFNYWLDDFDPALRAFKFLQLRVAR